ncbi:HigA family addiction module antitoxin [Pelagibaculum spongiae]|uniref:Addiction module antidote protein, HigA family n=1 Tax=Pelagibaculum spongiae TaxID=2080658 RepID=A0A2V1GSL7_9GAMM|nr:HigA family addiction module antitoxin [Pelagibaculum spongiae]PVZ68282.1 addiction module antidote protein, HigA family [Pelagibaculum spongiae]
MMTEQQAMSDLAIPPGEYLLEVLEDMEINQAELARRMGRPAQTINEILKGDKAITPETALQLEQVLGVPAYFWSNLESEYRLVLAKEAAFQQAQTETEIATAYPYNEIAKLGLVEKTRVAVEKVNQLKKFFGVSSLLNIESVKEYQPAFRQHENANTSNTALAAWLRAGHTLASQIKTSPFNKSSLLNALPDIRALSLETQPEKLLLALRQHLASCGVALVVIPHFTKTYTTGATYWVGKQKAVIMMSLRGGWTDIFWFSLFHEIAHILLHDKRTTFLEADAQNPQYRKQEEQADQFAQTTLIPQDQYDAFVVESDFSESAIIQFAQNIGIFAGIVTGRLQHDKHLTYNKNHHRIRFRWE